MCTAAGEGRRYRGFARMTDDHRDACFHYLWLVFNNGSIAELRATAAVIRFGAP